MLTEPTDSERIAALEERCQTLMLAGLDLATALGQLSAIVKLLMLEPELLPGESPPTVTGRPLLS